MDIYQFNHKYNNAFNANRQIVILLKKFSENYAYSLTFSIFQRSKINVFDPSEFC